jgi:outer membrane protein OmpA-like peptidoglycan-associated protein
VVLALVVALVLVALAVGFFACRGETPKNPTATTSPSGTPTPVETTVVIPGDVVPPSFAITVPGTDIVETDTAAVVTMRRGLFSPGGVEVSAQGKDTLRRLADEIRGHTNGLWVLVVGHTDAVPVTGPGPFADNVSLGMARAVAAIEFLRALRGMPYGIFVAATADGSDPIDSNTTDSGRARNRTVVIKIMQVTKTTR